MPLCGICGKNQASNKCINLQCGVCCSGGGCNKHKNKNKSKNGMGNAATASSAAAATGSSSGKRKAYASTFTPFMDDSGVFEPPRQRYHRGSPPPSSLSPLERVCQELEDAFDEVSHQLGIDTPKEKRYKVIRRVIIDHILKKRRKKEDSSYPSIDLAKYGGNGRSSYSQLCAYEVPDTEEDCRALAESIVHYGYNGGGERPFGPPLLADLRVLANTRRGYGHSYGSTDVWDDMQSEDPYPKEDDDDLEKYYDSDGSYVCEWQYVDKSDCQDVLKVFLRSRSSNGVDPPLVRFARSGNVEMVLALLGQGAHLEGSLTWEETEWKMGGYEKSWNWNGDSALMACARRGDDFMVNLLLRLGADHRHRCCYACDHHDNGVADAARRHGFTKTASLIEEYVKENGSKIDFPGLSLFGLAAAALPSYTGVPDLLIEEVVMIRAETMAAKQHSISRWKAVFAPSILDDI